MHAWIPTEALWWLGLYGGCGVLLPWLLRWTQKGREGLDTSPRKLFQGGELGLFGLVLAIATVLDLQRSNWPALLIGSNAFVVGIAGLMAASAWLEDYSRMEEGLASHDERTWVDSRKLLFLVFSIAFTIQVLLTHSAEAWRQ
jgi:hypothetical protein